MGELRVDYDSLEGITIPAMMKARGEIEESYNNMKKYVGELVENGYMESESATAHVEEFNNLLSPDITKLIEVIEEYYNQLKQICSNFSEGDSTWAGRVQR